MDPRFPSGILQPMTPEQSKRFGAINSARRRLTEHKPQEAFQALKVLGDDLKEDAEGLFLLASCYEMEHQYKLAAQTARKSIELRDHAEPNLIIARCLRAEGKTDEAIEVCDEVLAKAPGYHPALVVKSTALEEAGRYDESREIIEPQIQRFEAEGKPAPLAFRFGWAKLLIHDKKYDEAIETTRAILELPNLNDPQKRGQHHLLAKAHDKNRQYAEAFEAARMANTYEKVEFDPDLYTEQVTALIDNWSAENLAKFPVSECESEVPVFVAGMPRSGTSLIDQIIDAHPLAAGVGELSTIESFAARLSGAYDPSLDPPDCFGSFTPERWTQVANAYVEQIKSQADTGVQRIVNKALGNNKLVGLLAKLFPKTRIIHAIRDPRDVAISCFMGGFNNNYHAWTTQLDWIAHAWAQSQRMMEHWKRVLNVPILDVHYEKLVREPETEFPRIIEFLGLEWDDACREFYKSRRTVRTLSYDQVNRPLYTSSAGRHTNYAEFIKDVKFPSYDV